MSDHGYNLTALREACDEDVIEEIEVDEAASEAKLDSSTSKEQRINWDHTPIKQKK